MVSATTAPSYFFKEPLAERLNERKDSTASSASDAKPLENPLLGRDAPPLPSASDTTTTTSHNNNNPADGGGLRQRRTVTYRTGDEKENNYTNVGALTIIQQQQQPVVGQNGAGLPPPRSSYSLGTAAASSSSSAYSNNKSMAPSTTTMETGAAGTMIPRLSHNAAAATSTSTNCWVLVFGYATREQYSELLQRFQRYGRVVSHRGLCQPGQSNWIAIQYANDLEAKKALCHSVVQLSASGRGHGGGGNIYCGVQPLADDDPILLHKSNPLGWDLWRGGGQQDGSDNGTAGPWSTNNNNQPLTEQDILLKGHPQQQQQNHRKQRRRDGNICNRLMQWMLGVPSHLDEQQHQQAAI